MVKCRKIKVGDFVNYAGKEWVVSNRNDVNFRLIPRCISTGVPIVVPRKRVKSYADQTWRQNLKRGDSLRLYIGGSWTDAKVFEVKGRKIKVQPSLSNFTMSVSKNAGIIAKGENTFPLWVEDEVKHVVIDGECRVERAHNLLFPWTYVSESADRVEVGGPPRTKLKTISYEHYDTGGFPLKMFNSLTTLEIMTDICSKHSKHPEFLRHLAKQYCHGRMPLYPYARNHYGLEFYLSEALNNEDARHVQEMLLVGEHASVFHRNEWLIREHLSYPYLHAEFEVQAKMLKVHLFFTGIHTNKINEGISYILKRISIPMIYAPKKIAVDATPELQFILSRMLGMERTPVELLSTRKIPNSELRLDLKTGICHPEMKICGGQINARCIHYPTLVEELMKRSPMRTLVVVEKAALPLWNEFNQFYGRNRGFKPITVTTKTMFNMLQHAKSFELTERLFVLVDTQNQTAFSNWVRRFSCKVKWVLGYTGANSHAFKNPEQNDALNIDLDKDEMEQMGVHFPQIQTQPVIFNIEKDSYEDFMKRDAKYAPIAISENERHYQKYRKRDRLSGFLEHPELVPVYFRGERLDAVEATVKNISDKFGVSEKMLNARAKETCSVCLEDISDAAVTPCGHIFCTECLKQLQVRQIKCPMCRAKIPNFLKLSKKNTPGKIEMFEGAPYRVPENQKWGKKLDFIKKHPNATIVTGCSGHAAGDAKLLKRKLKKIFPKRTILTYEDILPNQVLVGNTIISMKPHTNVQAIIGNAWGKNITVFELKYHLKNKPYGQEFY